jgi:hypothetical protein
VAHHVKGEPLSFRFRAATRAEVSDVRALFTQAIKAVHITGRVSVKPRVPFRPQ